MGSIDGIDLRKACALLLGEGFCAAPGWRARLNPEIVKRAFRRQIFQVHPDRAQSLGIPSHVLTRQFQALQASYDVVSEYLVTPAAPVAAPPVHRRAPAPRPAQPTPRKAAHPRRPAATYYVGDRPARRLKFGEFLYYNGRISQEELFSAVRWQAAMRPRIGEIAMAFGYLDHARIHQLLELRQQARKLHQPLAEFARDQGYLSHFQWLAVMGRQKRLQRPLGTYWLDQGKFTAEELAEWEDTQRQHNWYYANKL